jgi:hypothetical protein
MEFVGSLFDESRLQGLNCSLPGQCSLCVPPRRFARAGKWQKRRSIVAMAAYPALDAMSKPSAESTPGPVDRVLTHAKARRR